jgi:tetratricopeptide (TPR) repeat protein
MMVRGGSAPGGAGLCLTSSAQFVLQSPPVELSRKSPGRRLGPTHYIFLGVLIIRLVALARLTFSPLLLPKQGDMHFYDHWALQIVHGHFTDHLAFYGLPLYAWLLALIYKVAGYGPFLPTLLQAACDAGTAVLLYKFGAVVFSLRNQAGCRGDRTLCPNAPGCGGFLQKPGEWIGCLAAVGWAFFVPAEAYAIILMPTTLFVFCFWLVVWRAVRGGDLTNAKECFWLGLLIGAVAMGVATMLALVPLVLVAIWYRCNSWHSLRRRMLLKQWTIFLVALVIGTSPCWIHNYFIARDPVLLSAHGGINFWIGNNPGANGYPRFPPGLHAGQEAMLKDSIRAAEKSAGHPLKRSEVSSFWSQKAKEYIRHNFSGWLKLLAIKFGNIWNAFQYDDLSMISALRELGVVWPGLYFGIVAALAIPGVLFAWRQFPDSRWVAAAVLLLMLSLLSVFVTERYRLAAVPGLLLFAAFAAVDLWQIFAGADFRRAAVYLSVLAAATWFVSIPRKDPSLWALDSYNSGWRALDSGDLDTAERKLGFAYAYVPGNAETNFALGNLRLAQGRPTAAKAFYRATLQLDPNHEGACNNLGILALDEKRWPLASIFFAKALEQDRQNPNTHYLLAEARFKAGELASARNEIERALQLNPAPSEFRRLQEQIESACAHGASN